jgi:hypothetical protein
VEVRNRPANVKPIQVIVDEAKRAGDGLPHGPAPSQC